MIEQISQFGNVFKIPELRRKILITIGILALCRLGVYIPIPGIDTSALHRLFEQSSQEGGLGRILGLVNMFAGGALSRAAVFGLGIMPYISASIIFQLLSSVIPTLEQLQKEGEAGRKKINQYTRMATVVLCFFQAFVMTRSLYSLEFEGRFIVPQDVRGIGFQLNAALLLTTGTMLLMWLGEQIDEFGIGSGISLIIMVNIIDRLPWAATQVFQNATWSLTPGEHQIGPLKVVLLIGFFLAIVVGVIFITQGQRRIPIQQAKHTRGRRVYGGQRHFLPLRVNQSGVMPIIFAQSIIIFPAAIADGIRSRVDKESFVYGLSTLVTDNLQAGTFVYTLVYIGFIFLFCYFWTAITFNPTDMASNMKDHGSFIPGIRPGRRTAEYLENILNRITLPGAAFLSLIALLPQLVAASLRVHYVVAGFYGGTALLIVVGVCLDLVQRIESHLIMRHYGGFLTSGRIRGRRR